MSGLTLQLSGKSIVAVSAETGRIGRGLTRVSEDRQYSCALPYLHLQSYYLLNSPVLLIPYSRLVHRLWEEAVTGVNI